MFVRLSGDKLVNTERIESIERNTYTEATTHWWVRMASGDVQRLCDAQYEQLLDALKQPQEHGVYDAERYWKRKVAESTLMGQFGVTRWQSMSEDAQYNAVSAEVERA